MANQPRIPLAMGGFPTHSEHPRGYTCTQIRRWPTDSYPALLQTNVAQLATGIYQEGHNLLVLIDSCKCGNWPICASVWIKDGVWETVDKVLRCPLTSELAQAISDNVDKPRGHRSFFQPIEKPRGIEDILTKPQLKHAEECVGCHIVTHNLNSEIKSALSDSAPRIIVLGRGQDDGIEGVHQVLRNVIGGLSGRRRDSSSESESQA